MSTLQFAKYGIIGFVSEENGKYTARDEHQIYYGNVNRFPDNLNEKERKVYDLAMSTYNHEDGVLNDAKVVIKESKEKSEYMTRDEMIMYIMSNPGRKITHELFDVDEYIVNINGNIVDENGYLFETFINKDTNHNGIRMRTEGEWETGWKVIS